MEVLLLIGRIFYALIFLGSGVAGHLGATDATAGYAEMRGLSNAKMLVRLTGVTNIAIAAGIILGIWMDLAALGAIVYLLAANILIHHFWTDEDEMMQQSEMTNFMKNLSMIGGALIIFVMASTGANLGWELGSPLFEFDPLP